MEDQTLEQRKTELVKTCCHLNFFNETYEI